MAEDESTYIKLPVEDRCIHKLWKARLHGYEEALRLFGGLNPDDDKWKKFHGIIKKFVIDINVVAQEKGLMATLAYAENCDSAGRNAPDIVEGLVSKCVGAPKAKTKDLAGQICLMFCEIEAHERVIEELLKGLTQKNPKTVAGCVTIISTCLRAFGTKLIKVSPLLKACIPLLDHRDKGIREECKKLIIESYRWVGEVMKTQLSGLKPVQLTELETEFEKLEGKARPERFIRSQQAAAGEHSAEDGGEGGEGGSGGPEEEEEESVDPYDLIEPADILSKIPKNFFELVEEKKWQLRKEALDALLPLSQTPKILPGDFNEIIRVLKKFMTKETNVMLVALAAQCIGGIAKGLRSAFKQGASILLPVCLEKFKEKKVSVVVQLQTVVDAFYTILGIEAIQEDVSVALKHKTPSVNAETARFLVRAFSKCPPPLLSNKKLLKAYVNSLLEKLSVSDPSVRDCASEALGVLLKFLGESNILKHMPDLDNIKLEKIKEFAGKAELTGKTAAQLQAAPPPKAKVVKPKAGGPRIVTAPESEEDLAPLPKKAPAGKKVPAGKKAPGKARKPEEGKKAAPSAAKSRFGMVATAASNKKKSNEDEGGSSAPYVCASLKNTRFKEEAKFKVLKWNFSTPRPEFVEQLQDQMTNANFNKALLAQMFHNDFKQHIKVIDALLKYLPKDMDALKDNLDLILKWLTLRFFETSPSVLMKGLDYLKSVFKLLAEDSYVLHEIEATSFIPYLVNKVGDPKEAIRNSIKEIFKIMGQIYAANKLVGFFMTGLASKNSKQRTECLDELAHLIKGFGIGVLQSSSSNNLKEIAKQISDRDTGVRNAAMNTIAEAYFQEGEKMYKMIGNLPEKDMTMLEERIKRASKTRQPPSNEQQAPQTQAHQPSPPPASSNKNANIPKPGGGRSIPSRSARAQRTLVNQNIINNNQNEANNNPPSSKGGGSPSRPMSGAFTLNYEEIEAVSEHRMSESGPRLVRHNLDDIFGDVSLPKTQTSKATFSSPPPHTATTHGGSNNYHHSSHTSPLSENSEVYEALDLIISQVFSLDIKTALNALTQLDDLIKDHEKVHLIKNRLDQFLLACCNKYKHVIFTMMPTDNCNEKDVIKLFQFTTMALMSLYHRSDITKNTSLASLHDLIEVMINILTEPKVHELPEISSLIKAMNVLTIKIVDRSNHTNVTCAFVRLLKKSVPTSGLRPKFADLVMKCLWKIIRSLDQWMPELQIDVLLAELHEFLKAYPQSYWKMQDTDTHLRTVKTIVHMLAKSKGPDIMNYLGKIQDPENSDLLPYLQKIMHSVSAGGEDGRKTGSNGSHSSSGKHSRFSKTDHETLAEIFKKIGQKDLTKQGLEELYNFKQANPQADLEPFFARSSQYFRDFIEKGLKKIEMEVKGGSLGGGGNANLSAPNHSHGSSRFVLSDNVSAEGSGSSGVGGVGGGSGSSSSGQAHAFFLDRLKRLRTAGGLDNDDVGQENKAGGANSHMRLYAPRKVDARLLDTPSGIPTSTHSSTRSNIPESSTQIEDIRKRLEKIKQSAF